MPAPDSQALHSAGAEGEARGGGLARTNREALRMTWAPTWGVPSPRQRVGGRGAASLRVDRVVGPPPTLISC